MYVCERERERREEREREERGEREREERGERERERERHANPNIKTKRH